MHPETSVAKLFLLAILGLGVMIGYGRLTASSPAPAGPGATQPRRAPAPARASVTAARAPGASALTRGPETRAPLIAQLARIEARRRLALAGTAVYLDSILVSPDSTIRRWGDDAVLRIWIGRPLDAAPVAEVVREAIVAWQELRLGPSLLVTSDSAKANVLVGWVSDSAPERTGLAQVESSGNGEIQFVKISLARTGARGRILGLEETRSVALHELGHALGLPHSGRAGDIMYPTVSVSQLSDRDRASAQLLYAISPGALREPPAP